MEHNFFKVKLFELFEDLFQFYWLCCSSALGGDLTNQCWLVREVAAVSSVATGSLT